MNGMVNWKNINSNPMAALSGKQRMIDVLLGKRNAVNRRQRDSFIRRDNCVDKIGLYTAPASKTAGKVSDEILDKINFAYLDGTELPDGFIFEGVKYSKEDFPSVSLDKCEKLLLKTMPSFFSPENTISLWMKGVRHIFSLVPMGVCISPYQTQREA